MAVMHGPRPNGDVYLQEPASLRATQRPRTPHPTTLPDRDASGVKSQSSPTRFEGGDPVSIFVIPFGRNLMTKPDTKDARAALALRIAENRSNYQLAEELTKQYLRLVNCYPGQWELLIQHMLTGHGFDLANPAARVSRHGAPLISNCWSNGSLSFAKEFAKSLKGGGSDEF